MKKFTPLTFFAVALLFLIAVSSVSANNVCSKEHYYKRNVLGKRTNVKKCPCALAKSAFEGKVVGLIVSAQDECGSTTFTGFISKGFDDPQKHNFTFAIADKCGKIIHELGDLGATFADGGTKPFSKKFDNINLNCDKDGILLPSSTSYSKRTNECYNYYKRQAGSGSNFVNAYEDGQELSSASLDQIF